MEIKLLVRRLRPSNANSDSFPVFFIPIFGWHFVIFLFSIATLTSRIFFKNDDIRSDSDLIISI